MTDHAPTLPFTGFEVVHHGKGKQATLEVFCASCGDRVAVSAGSDPTRAIELAEQNRERNACCTCSLIAIIAGALDDGHGSPDDEIPAAWEVVSALVDYGWRFQTDRGGTVQPRLIARPAKDTAPL